MTEQKFRSEMRRAHTLSKLNPDDTDYYAGYMRGLSRSYHGEAFGNPGEHELWLSFAERDDHRSKRRGDGYSDGLAAGTISSTIGAPKKIPGETVVLPALRVSATVKTWLDKKSEENKIDISALRREALDKFVRQNIT